MESTTIDSLDIHALKQLIRGFLRVSKQQYLRGQNMLFLHQIFSFADNGGSLATTSTCDYKAVIFEFYDRIPLLRVEWIFP